MELRGSHTFFQGETHVGSQQKTRRKDSYWRERLHHGRGHRPRQGAHRHRGPARHAGLPAGASAPQGHSADRVGSPGHAQVTNQAVLWRESLI